MKTRTKALLLVLCAALLVAVTALTTIAWLTHTPDPVVNTFTFSDNDNVNITLDEAWVDEYGEKGITKKDTTTSDGLELVEKEFVSDIADADRVLANKYKLVPGHYYYKDPTIHVGANSIDCYLFVTVDNGIADIEDKSLTGNTIANQMKTLGWIKVEGYTNVYALATTTQQDDGTTKTQLTKKSAGDNAVVFRNFKIKGEETAISLAAYADAEVKVIAYAVQAEGFEDMDPKTAWETAFPGKGTAETPEPETTPDPAE